MTTAEKKKKYNQEYDIWWMERGIDMKTRPLKSEVKEDVYGGLQCDFTAGELISEQAKTSCNNGPRVTTDPGLTHLTG